MAGVDEIGPWSEEKLNILADYLKAYCTILNAKKRQGKISEYCYIDAFAGSVTPTRKDTKAYVEGSPLRALRTEPAFDRYIFIDINKTRIKERIARLPEQFPEKADRIHIYQGDCNDILISEIIPRFHWKTGRRGIVFLDPYAPNVRWDVVRLLASAKTFDVFINYPLMGLTRLLPIKHPPTENHRKIISNVLGCEEWYDKVYGEEPWKLLMGGEQPIVRQVNPIPWLTKYYVDCLDDAFDCVSDIKLMRNSKNAPLYALVLASRVGVATKIMNDIFNKYELYR